MSLPMEDRSDRNADVHAAEETLRILANLPAPEGLEDRVKAGLRSAPRRGLIIAWPLAPEENWLHAAAAALIVAAVAGGGWGVYSHIQVAPVPTALVEPQVPDRTGRFSTAGAMRIPQTVHGPVVAAPVIEETKQEPTEALQNPQRHALKKGKANARPSAATPAAVK